MKWHLRKLLLRFGFYHESAIAPLLQKELIKYYDQGFVDGWCAGKRPLALHTGDTPSQEIARVH